MFDYEAAVGTANELIEFFGQEITLVKVTKSGTDYAPTVETANHTVIAADLMQEVMPVRRDGNPDNMIGKSERVLYVAAKGLAAGIEPTKDDRVTVKGKEHQIVSVEPLAPAGTTVFWTVRLAG